MDSNAKTNRSLWDGWTEINARSSMYDVEGFKAGRSSLKPVEREQLGDVSGRSLLHLQCHFGMDTLSWARLGARVTGVDFSERAIETARGLAQELAIPARFVCDDVLALDLGERFDIVFTSYGTICWLSDLDRWARVIASHLAPGGTFYMVEFHPYLSALDDDGRTVCAPYSQPERPEYYQQHGGYSDPEAEFHHPSWQWHYGIGDVVTALLGAGLRLELLHELPYSSWNCFPFMEPAGPDRYTIRGAPPGTPLMFSVRARKAE